MRSGICEDWTRSCVSSKTGVDAAGRALQENADGDRDLADEYDEISRARVQRVTDASERYINRELSLLDFQERVLALSASSEQPLLERVKFLAIVSHNIDEFFQVRVAGLLSQVQGGVVALSPDRHTPRHQLSLIEARVRELTAAIDSIFTDEIAPALEKESIRIASWEDLTAEDKAGLGEVFESEIFPVLTPLAVDPSHPFPYISDLSLNLAVLLRGPDRESLQFARVKIPEILPRFVVLPDGERFVPLEQVVANHLDRLFGGQAVVGHSFFRVTRNADYAIEEEEAQDLLAAMESVLQFRRRSAAAVRLEIDSKTPKKVERLLVREMDLDESLVYPRTTPLDLSGLFAIHALDRPDLKDEQWHPTTPARLTEGGKDVDLFAEIRAADLLVHHPYESFSTSTGAFLAQAAADPDVLAIKQTLYRTSASDDPALGGERPVVESLIAAAEAGKQVVVLVELKARFDEAANIEWARMLENAGAHVVYGVAGLKTHSKILLVVRREAGRLRRYCNIGTGNYNPKTARLYEDLGLFTSASKIGADLSEVFNRLTGYATNDSYRRLLVAPETLFTQIVEFIRREADKRSEGRILMKINHLVDPEIIDELYRASQRGCLIQLIVRGQCSLRAGIPGLSETITVRSIVGRFLEHSRIYRFGSPGSDGDYYLGSADMMQRNLSGRVETLAPVRDDRLRDRLDEMIDVLLADDELAWELGPDGSWTKCPTVRAVNSHVRMQQLADQRSRSTLDLPVR
ncbi:MAG: polyphosphate kinase 1 [Acidimicrobiia bacterium]